MGKIRVGVIGAGSWTVASHLPNLNRAHDVDLVAVCRKGPKLLKKIQRDFGFRVASEDYRDVLASEVDVCVIASPSSLHYEHAVAALRAGAHVMCEKPVTIDPKQAWEMVSVAEQNNRHLVIAFGWNYRPMVKRAKSMMDDRGIGNLEHMSVHMSSTTRELLSNSGTYPEAAPDTIPEASTWTDPALSGGGYGQAQLSHALGLALWLTGARVESGFALMSHPVQSRVELHDAITYRFDGGAIGTVSGGSAHLGAGSNKHALEVRAIGDAGQLLLDVEREAVWLFRDGNEEKVELSDGSGAYDCAGPIEALLAAGRGESFVNHSPGELGARTVEALNIAYRSAASGVLETRG